MTSGSDERWPSTMSSSPVWSAIGNGSSVVDPPEVNRTKKPSSPALSRSTVTVSLPRPVLSSVVVRLPVSARSCVAVILTVSLPGPVQ